MTDGHALILFISGMCALLGVGFLITAFFEKTYKKAFFLGWGTGCLATPVLAVLGILIKSERLTVVSLFLPISFILIFTFFYQVYSQKRCILPIQAKCTDFIETNSRGIVSRNPKFTYYYEDREITSTLLFPYKEKVFDKLLTVGKTYTIHIDPQNPTRYVYQKRVSAGACITLIIGILLLLFCIFIISTSMDISVG